MSNRENAANSDEKKENNAENLCTMTIMLKGVLNIHVMLILNVRD